MVVSTQWSTPDEVSMTTLRRLYLGRLNRWAGMRVERYHLPLGSAERLAFGGAVLDRTERELEDYWLEQALTGGSIPPKELESRGRMLEVIRERPGAMGYVPVSALSGEAGRGIRVLSLLTADGALRPDQRRYPIQVARNAIRDDRGRGDDEESPP